MLEKSFYTNLPNWMNERSSAKRIRGITWTSFIVEKQPGYVKRVCPSDSLVEMKFHCSPTSFFNRNRCPSSNGITPRNQFLSNFHPSPYLRAHVSLDGSFGWKFEIFRDNSIGRVVELQTRIWRKYRAELSRISLKIKSLSQIPPNPENSSPDTRFCSFFFTKSLSSSRVLDRIIHG